MNEQERELRDRLRSDPDREPLRPVWPAVEERLRPRRRPPGARFVLGAGLAALVGIWVGVQLDPSDREASASPDLWSSFGTSLAVDGGDALADVYGLDEEASS
jgi:hypothetical protein